MVLAYVVWRVYAYFAYDWGKWPILMDFAVFFVMMVLGAVGSSMDEEYEKVAPHPIVREQLEEEGHLILGSAKLLCCTRAGEEEEHYYYACLEISESDLQRFADLNHGSLGDDIVSGPLKEKYNEALKQHVKYNSGCKKTAREDKDPVALRMVALDNAVAYVVRTQNRPGINRMYLTMRVEKSESDKK
ncbi:MAG: hypothetical protein ACAI35_02690 [Candidatus Methylacidiphilales bacterium]|nr:hypothetical protein [Candidatus Methylacidiphilales bacterium]